MHVALAMYPRACNQLTDKPGDVGSLAMSVRHIDIIPGAVSTQVQHYGLTQITALNSWITWSGNMSAQLHRFQR